MWSVIRICPNLPTHSTISGCHFAFPPHVSTRNSAPLGNILSLRHDVVTTLRQLRCDELVIIPFHVGILVQFTTGVTTTEIILQLGISRLGSRREFAYTWWVVCRKCIHIWACHPHFFERPRYVQQYHHKLPRAFVMATNSLLEQGVGL